MVALARARIPREQVLPATMLARYLTFLARRPISRSNTHFLNRRLGSILSLLPLLEGVDDSFEPALLRQIASLTPAKLRHVAPAASQALLAALPAYRPAAAVRCHEPPSEGFLSALCQIRVIFGPGIGIGDEIACAGLIDQLQAKLPRAELTVMTAYQGIWERLAQPSAIDVYDRGCQIIEALRAGPNGALTLLIDFESPGLLDAVVEDASVGAYAELELGLQRLRVWDPRRRRLHSCTLGGTYNRNLYQGLWDLLDWCLESLGGNRKRPAVARPQLQRPPQKDVEHPQALVIPFTSKYDPELTYWAALLRDLRRKCGELRIRVGAGTNHDTARFARALVAAVGDGDNVSVSLLAQRPVGLGEALDAIASADLVLCADTFAAHAAPRLGTPSVVLARTGLAYWRVPASHAFYLPERMATERLAAAIHTIIVTATGAIAAVALAQWRQDADGLIRQSQQLRESLTSPASGSFQAWDDYDRAWCRAVNRTLDWPAHYDGLLGDVDYVATCTSALSRDNTMVWDAVLTDYTQSVLAARSNTNLYKLLKLSATSDARDKKGAA